MDPEDSAKSGNETAPEDGTNDGGPNDGPGGPQVSAIGSTSAAAPVSWWTRTAGVATLISAVVAAVAL